MIWPLRPGWPPPIVGGAAAGVAEDAAPDTERPPPDETPRERCLRTGDEQGLRLAIVQLAEGVVGLDVTQPAYLDLVAPNPTDRADTWLMRDMAKMSGCSLTAGGILRRAGALHPKLHRHYINGTAVSLMVDVAIDTGARLPATTPPEPGHILIVGEGRREHVLTVTSRLELELVTVRSVDGGQRNKDTGIQDVQACARRWQIRSGKAYLDDRQVHYVLDAVRMVLGKPA